MVPDTLTAVDAIFERFAARQVVPGFAYGVVVDGELAHTGGAGTLRVGEDVAPDADSVFRIASMTKSFTAAAVLLLRDEGRLRLDDPVARWVPELAGLPPRTTDSPPMTLEHLLTMTAGFPTDDPWGDRQQGLDLGAFAEFFRVGPSLDWAPGTHFEYSNLGYGILGLVVTNAAGMEYREFVRARLLAPLGMAATTVPEAPIALAAVAGRIAALLGEAGPSWPTEVPLASTADRPAIERALRASEARFGPVTLGRLTGGDGAKSTAWRLTGERGDLSLELALDEPGGTIAKVALVPRSLEAPVEPD